MEHFDEYRQQLRQVRERAHTNFEIADTQIQTIVTYMYQDYQPVPVIPPPPHHFKPHCIYDLHYHRDQVREAEDLGWTTEEEPELHKHKPSRNRPQQHQSSPSPTPYDEPEWMTIDQTPPPIFRTRPIPSRPGRRNRTRPCIEAVTDDNKYTYLEYDNDPVQHYDDITKTEMNIIYLDRDSLPPMQPLAPPPTNTRIQLDFRNRDDEWCTHHYSFIQQLDANVYQQPTTSQLYAIIDTTYHRSIISKPNFNKTSP